MNLARCIQLLLCILVSIVAWHCVSSPRTKISPFDAACLQMLRDDPGLRSERLLNYGTTSPIFYYGALAVASRKDSSKDELVAAGWLDTELPRVFAPQPVATARRCRMLTIEPGERRRYWDDWVIEISPPLRNIYAPRHEYGIFVRGSLGGGQSGLYYWLALQEDGTPASVIRLDVSESP